MEFRHSKTMVNLMKSFAGESQARNRYTFFASKARKEGFRQIEGIFEETAANEKEHAEVFYKLILEFNKETVDNIEITAGFPCVLGDTLENLEAAAAGEHEENTVLYPEFARIAKEEGFEKIAVAFREISEVEEAHEKRYRKLIESVKGGTVFKKDEVVKWKCRNCGYIHEGKEAPNLCPACAHPQEYYEVLCENY